MKLFNRQLTIFQRGMGYEGPQSHYVVLAWHWNWSITWRWLLWYTPGFRWKPTIRFGQKPDKTIYINAGLFIGSFFFSTQKNMKYT